MASQILKDYSVFAYHESEFVVIMHTRYRKELDKETPIKIYVYAFITRRIGLVALVKGKPR
jgi:hypothetical protein